MENVNKQLLDALKGLLEFHDNPAPFSGKTGDERMFALENQAAKRNALIYSARQAIAAAEQAQQSKTVTLEQLVAKLKAEEGGDAISAAMDQACADMELGRRMREQAQQVCRDCNGTGNRDSGGVHSWGEPIMVPCDCQDQQQAEPVARIKTVGGYPDDSRHELELLVRHGQLSDGQLLYAAQPPAVAVPVLRDWPKLLEMARQIIRDGHVHDVGGGDLAVTTCEAFEGLDAFLKKNFPEPLGELTGQERKWLEAEAAIQPPFVPDGYALVPIEPTDDMCAAAWESEGTDYVGEHHRIVRFDIAYMAAIAAAQKGGQ